jgi:DNA-binding NarL/FixJ family response regulator
MAARGLPSKEIARRLVVSVRTVDNTLHQVYAKLAVNNRAQRHPGTVQVTIDSRARWLS